MCIWEMDSEGVHKAKCTSNDVDLTCASYLATRIHLNR